MEEGKKEKIAAIVLSAGMGKRMHSDTAKQYLLLRGKPILYYPLHTFQNSPVDEIILVIRAEDRAFVTEQIVEKYGFDKVKAIVEGGKERYHSVQNGLLALRGTGTLNRGDFARCESSVPKADGAMQCGDSARNGLSLLPRDCTPPDYVLIHDGARPFLTKEIIRNAIDCVRSRKACVVGMPAKDTIKLTRGDDTIDSTPPRSLVWTAQTPQVFSYNLIAEAYDRLIKEEELLKEKGITITDDAGVLELFTHTDIKMIPGSYENIKITTPEDLLLAELLYDRVFGNCKDAS